MKQVALLLIAVTLTFAGRKEIDQLNAEMMELQESNGSIVDEKKKYEAKNTSITAQNKTLTEKNKKLSKEVETLRMDVKKKDGIIAAYKRNTVQVDESSSKTPAVPVYPISAKILKKNVHDASNLAMLLTIYNGSAEALNGFSANLQFVQNGVVLLECLVDINKNFPSGENVIWNGAIPYDSTDPSNMVLYNANKETVQVIVDVKSVILTNGVTRKY